VVFFGVNTDSVLATVTPQGLSVQETMAPQKPDPQWIANAFANTMMSDVQPHRLLKASVFVAIGLIRRAPPNFSRAATP